MPNCKSRRGAFLRSSLSSCGDARATGESQRRRRTDAIRLEGEKKGIGVKASTRSSNHRWSFILRCRDSNTEEKAQIVRG